MEDLGDHIWFAMRTSVPRCRAAWQDAGMENLDAAILLRRNYNVADTVEYCVYLCFNCVYRFLIASMSIDATKMEYQPCPSEYRNLP
jgi:hypothetical protein